MICGCILKPFFAFGAAGSFCLTVITVGTVSGSYVGLTVIVLLNS